MNKTLIDTVKNKNLTMVAVTKNHTKEEVDQLAALGCDLFGENRVQEFLTKYDPKYHWHLIGHLQTNKVKYVVGKVDVIESVDSCKLAKEIEKQAKKADIVQDVYVEIKISETDTAKSGIPMDQAMELLEQIEALPHVRCTGLMTIATNTRDEHLLRREFSEMQAFYQKARSQYPTLCACSMGMSQDWHLAAQYGSTHVRIGRALFE